MNNRSSMPTKIVLRRVLLAVLDMVLVTCGFYIGWFIRSDGESVEWLPHELTVLYENLPWILSIYAIIFVVGGLYTILWKYAGVRDLFRLGSMVALSTVLVLIGNQMVHGVLYQSAIAIGAMFIALLVGGIRLLWRVYLNGSFTGNTKGSDGTNAQLPILIVGAGQAGAWVINLCKGKASYGNPIVAVDDDPAKQNQTIQGVPVLGTIDNIPALCDEFNIREILIAIPTLRGSRLSQVVDICNATHCRVKVLSDPQAVCQNEISPQGAFRELNTADFLSRDEVTLDTEKINAYLKDEVVLVTGGGGSIGSELCRQIMRFQPRQLLVFDIYENCAYELEMELRQKYGAEVPVVVLVGSIRDKQRLNNVFAEYQPSVVFHAAAHKHVPLMEISPAEAIKNNVFGTKNLLSVASEYGVKRLVQLSTDKAVNPTSVMGSTKRICEMLIQCFAEKTTMRCVAVRFGNVLGSHGSVIPLFESQIKKGGPVTVTDEGIERYFMTIPEAAQLVLQAGALAHSGSIYVLDMGEPVKIMDLARQLIRFYGYEPDVNMPIRVTGLRPGEKLFEELMMDEEQSKMKRTEHNKIYIAPPRDIDLAVFYEQLQCLFDAAEQSGEAVVCQLQKIVPTFQPNRAMMCNKKPEQQEEG
ncbi:MAG: nucleoside-diphosphate sugar epimerase/dehydratase [Faecalibacterium sp.]